MIPVSPQQPGAQPLPASAPQENGAPPVTIDAVMALLRDGAMRRFRIDIEVDSTITGDESQERQDRSQFIEATTKFVEAWGPIVAQQPLMAQLAGEMLLFGTRAFRVGRSLEEVIEETVDKLETQAAQPKPPPQPSPEDQAKTQQAQIKAQAEGQKSQMEMQIKQIEAQAKQQQVAMEAQAEQQRLAMESQAQKMDMLIKMLEHTQTVKEHAMHAAEADRSHARNLEVIDHKAEQAQQPKGGE